MNHDPSNWENAVKWSAASLYGGMSCTWILSAQILTNSCYSEHRIGEEVRPSGTFMPTDVVTVVCDTVDFLPGNGDEPRRAKESAS